MKKKNIILSLTFLMTSIGTALGTTFYFPVPTYVHSMRQVIGGNPVETCSTLGNKCDGGTAGVTCLITVATTTGSDVTQGYGANAGVFCSVPLKHSIPTPIDDGKTTIYFTIE